MILCKNYNIMLPYQLYKSLYLGWNCCCISQAALYFTREDNCTDPILLTKGRDQEKVAREETFQYFGENYYWKPRWKSASIKSRLTIIIINFVGSESGIILLSTVRSKPRDEISIQGGSSGERKNADIGWIRRNLGFVTDRHQICVGLTRCKYGLVIIGRWTGILLINCMQISASIYHR